MELLLLYMPVAIEIQAFQRCWQNTHHATTHFSTTFSLHVNISSTSHVLSAHFINVTSFVTLYRLN